MSSEAYLRDTLFQIATFHDLHMEHKPHPMMAVYGRLGLLIITIEY